jgi:hypothetical protein
MLEWLKETYWKAADVAIAIEMLVFIQASKRK